ncbi:lysostaphin resistance A-like protein [Luteolibacter sp. Populi]|uniref:CPBP family intramembrane glutamic endopeptidase n=1 Tax=Luteolibacter sp. Populi TaxID=3230487 RepID=UPI0034662D95
MSGLADSPAVRKRRRLPLWLLGMLVLLWFLSIADTVVRIHSAPLESWSAWRIADQELRLAEFEGTGFSGALFDEKVRDRQELMQHWAAILEKDPDPRSRSGAAVLWHLAGQAGKAAAVPVDGGDNPERMALVASLLKGEEADGYKLGNWGSLVAAGGETYWWEEQLFLRLATGDETVLSDVAEASRARNERCLHAAALGSWVDLAIAAGGALFLAVYLWQSRCRLRIGPVPAVFRKMDWRRVVAGVAIAELLAFGLLVLLGVGLAGYQGWTHEEFAIHDTIWRGASASFLMLVFFRRPRTAWRALHLNRAFSMKAVSGAVGLAVILAGICWWLLPHGGENLYGGGISPWTFGFPGLLFILWSGCVVAPLFEEIVYRGFFFNALAARFGIWAGIVVANGVFAAIHAYGWNDSISVFLFGVVSSVLYRMSGSLAASVICHALLNFYIFTVTWWEFEATYG